MITIARAADLAWSVKLAPRLCAALHCLCALGRVSLWLIAHVVLPPPLGRPAHTDHARLARWLVHQTDWGVVSTLSRHLGGAPFGNVVSHADGPPCVGRGALRLHAY